MSEIPNKAFAQEAISKYQEVLDNIPKWIEESGETVTYWGNLLGINRSAISNKKHGRREWKPREIKTILEALKKETKWVDDYLLVLDSIDKMLVNRGLVKKIAYEKAGLTQGQQFTRTKNSKKGAYEIWDVNEIKKLVEVL